MNRKTKYLVRLIALVLVLMIPSIALADAGEWKGKVIARQITFRSAPKTNAKSLGTLKNGTTVAILDDYTSGWFHIAVDGKEGYVLSEYIVENPDHLTVTSTVPVYAFPHSDKHVGSLATYTRLTIIDEYDGYYVVNLREASGFIKKNAKIIVDSKAVAQPRRGVVEMNIDTTLREGPASKYPSAGDVPAGSQFDYISMDGDWYIIIVDNERIAYIWNGVCHEV